MNRITIVLAGTAMMALVAQPVLASATRSGSVLPLIAMESAASSGANGGADRCARINDDYVEVDANGSPILDNAGKMIGCRPSSGGAPAGNGGHPLFIALGLLAAGGLVASASGGGGGSPGGGGGGGADSPG